MKRQGKKVNMNIREYCTMCDLHFFGNLIVHRKNDRHQQLKNYLHPRCSPCGKEFPTRVEWDHHRLTPLHLRKTAEARSKSRKSGSDDEFGIEELISGKEVERGTEKDRCSEHFSGGMRLREPSTTICSD
ncbi:hypothetical protein C0J52_11138 [Blattella germanica]|nr:hypothetical protein C0J52_11138 [Blattella germanica]